MTRVTRVSTQLSAAYHISQDKRIATHQPRCALLHQLAIRSMEANEVKAAQVDLVLDGVVCVFFVLSVSIHAIKLASFCESLALLCNETLVRLLETANVAVQG